MGNTGSKFKKFGRNVKKGFQDTGRGIKYGFEQVGKGIKCIWDGLAHDVSPSGIKENWNKGVAEKRKQRKHYLMILRIQVESFG